MTDKVVERRPRDPHLPPAHGRRIRADRIGVAAAARGDRGREARSSDSSWVAGSLGVLGLVLGAVVPWLYLKWRHGRRLGAFNGQLAADARPDGGRPPGRPVAAAGGGHRRHARATSRWRANCGGPWSSSDSASTSPMHWTSVGDRMDSEDFGWVVMAIRIQREVGGNLAEILHTVVRHAARAGVPPSPGQGPQRRGTPVRLHPDGAALLDLRLHAHPTGSTLPCSTPREWVTSC